MPLLLARSLAIRIALSLTIPQCQGNLSPTAFFAFSHRSRTRSTLGSNQDSRFKILTRHIPYTGYAKANTRRLITSCIPLLRLQESTNSTTLLGFGSSAVRHWQTSSRDSTYVSCERTLHLSVENNKHLAGGQDSKHTFDSCVKMLQWRIDVKYDRATSLD